MAGGACRPPSPQADWNAKRPVARRRASAHTNSCPTGSIGYGELGRPELADWRSRDTLGAATHFEFIDRREDESLEARHAHPGHLLTERGFAMRHRNGTRVPLLIVLAILATVESGWCRDESKPRAAFADDVILFVNGKKWSGPLPASLSQRYVAAAAATGEAPASMSDAAIGCRGWDPGPGLDALEVARSAGLERIEGAGGAPPRYLVRIAIETNHGWFASIGSIEAAVQYIGNLIASVSEIYSRDVGAEFVVGFLSLWPDRDPWGSNVIDSIVNYWEDNRGDVPRAFLHIVTDQGMFSGESSLSLCSPMAWSCSGHGSVVNHQILYVVAHEFGHQFGSKHTQCYSPPVDGCSTNAVGSLYPCYDGPTSVPRNGGGSIMSYCPPEQVALWLGREGHHGQSSERVPTLMRATLQNAFGRPGCPITIEGAAAAGDADGDQRPDDQDNCPDKYNPSQYDVDRDGAGNECDSEDLPLTVGPVSVSGIGRTSAKFVVQGAYGIDYEDPLTSNEFRFSEGYRVRIRGADSSEVAFTWPAESCKERRDHRAQGQVLGVVCKDPATGSMFKIRSAKGLHTFTARGSGGAGPATMTGPVRVWLTHVASDLDRVGSKAGCIGFGSRLVCR
jgi:hypothetical protein